jgi:MoaA/NifB/PqqE/SkfB family radical SAM enzyme
MSPKTSQKPPVKNPKHLKIGVMNGGVATDFLQKAPCTIGYSYVRFVVTGDVKACCISKYPLGNVTKEPWQKIWNSRSYEAFREKMKTIQDSHFHLKDPDWGFCQQCCHRTQNETNYEMLQTPFEPELEPADEKPKKSR